MGACRSYIHLTFNLKISQQEKENHIRSTLEKAEKDVGKERKEKMRMIKKIQERVLLTEDEFIRKEERVGRALSKEAQEHPVQPLRGCRGTRQMVMEEMHLNGGCTSHGGGPSTTRVQGANLSTVPERLLDQGSVQGVAPMMKSQTECLEMDREVWFMRTSHVRRCHGAELATEDAPFVGEMTVA